MPEPIETPVPVNQPREPLKQLEADRLRYRRIQQIVGFVTWAIMTLFSLLYFYSPATQSQLNANGIELIKSFLQGGAMTFALRLDGRDAHELMKKYLPEGMLQQINETIDMGIITNVVGLTPRDVDRGDGLRPARGYFPRNEGL